MRMIERRIGLLFAGFLLCFLVIVGRAFWLQGVQGAQLASEAAYQQTETVTVPGLRGTLLDRHGNPLAVLRRRGDDLRDALPGEEPAEGGGQAGLDPRRKQQGDARSADRRIRLLLRRPAKSTLPTAARIERLELPGIGELPDSRRTYPQGEMAGQVIGAVGSENQGLTGLEQGEESTLRGTDGERRVVNDALGEPIRLETVREAEDGSDVQLTLDPAIQTKTEEVLGRSRRNLLAEGGDGDRRSTRATRRSWRWPTGRRSTPPTSKTPPPKT